MKNKLLPFRNWNAEAERATAWYWKWVAAQPDLVVFNEPELTHASLAICEFFGVDSDDDFTCIEIERMLMERGRTVDRAAARPLDAEST